MAGGGGGRSVRRRAGAGRGAASPTGTGGRETSTPGIGCLYIGAGPPVPAFGGGLPEVGEYWARGWGRTGPRGVK